MIDRVRRRLVRLRRRVFEFLGDGRYSRSARDGIDRKLERYLPPCGFFVEAGAHDGFSDSNTYYLEKIKNWQGVLIEPIPGNYSSCKKVRTRSAVFCCALVAPDHPSPTIRMTWADRMSWVAGAYDPSEEARRRAKVSRWLAPQTCEVPARALTSVLDEARAPQVDFLSLDVEGFECQVLQGLDFSRYRPTWMLIECQTLQARGEVEAFLSREYRIQDDLSHHDYLFRALEPGRAGEPKP